MAFFEDLQAWHWVILGLLLFGAEMVGTGGFLLGAGIAAFIQALIVSILVDMSWQMQLTIFSVDSVLMTVVYWRFFRVYNEATDHDQINDRAAQMIGRSVVIQEAINTGEGRVQIGDTFWRVKTDVKLEKDAVAEVIASEGMVLKLALKS